MSGYEREFSVFAIKSECLPNNLLHSFFLKNFQCTVVGKYLINSPYIFAEDVSLRPKMSAQE